jgi:YCII-related domain
MKNFLAVFTGTPQAFEKWMKLSDAERKEQEQIGLEAWGDWMTKHQASIVFQGGPLGKTKSASAKGVADIRNNLAGFIVVRAESHAAAAQMFENHPHFTIFPGEAVEVMECLPLPGQ